MPDKIDFKRQYKTLYTASPKRISLVDVPKLPFLTLTGQGDPETSPDFQGKVEALYGISFTLKFMNKETGWGPDYAVPPLEGLWWADKLTDFADMIRENWKWKLMILQPDFISEEMMEQSVAKVARKRPSPYPGQAKLESFTEGLSAQVLHVGPYREATETIRNLHEFIKANNYDLRGEHHEVYLSDPRRASPDKLRTIIRQPVRAVL